MLKKTQPSEQDIPWWNGKRSHFPQHRKEAGAFAVSVNANILLEIARAFFSAQQVMAADAKSRGEVFDRDLSSQEPAIWTTVLTETKLKARMGVLKTTIMKETFGTNWTKHAELGFANTAELKDAQGMALADWLRAKQTLLIRKLWQAAFPDKPHKETKDDSTLAIHKEALRHILSANDITALLD